MPLQYFIYYRIRPETAALAASTVNAMQAQLARDSGVAGRLLCQADDGATWMEIYEPVADPATFEDALERLTEEMRLANFLAPGQVRHIERFSACA